MFGSLVRLSYVRILYIEISVCIINISIYNTEILTVIKINKRKNNSQNVREKQRKTNMKKQMSKGKKGREITTTKMPACKGKIA